MIALKDLPLPVHRLVASFSKASRETFTSRLIETSKQDKYGPQKILTEQLFNEIYYNYDMNKIGVAIVTATLAELKKEQSPQAYLRTLNRASTRRKFYMKNNNERPTKSNLSLVNFLSAEIVQARIAAENAPKEKHAETEFTYEFKDMIQYESKNRAPEYFQGFSGLTADPPYYSGLGMDPKYVKEALENIHKNLKELVDERAAQNFVKLVEQVKQPSPTNFLHALKAFESAGFTWDADLYPYQARYCNETGSGLDIQIEKEGQARGSLFAAMASGKTNFTREDIVGAFLAKRQEELIEKARPEKPLSRKRGLFAKKLG